MLSWEQTPSITSLRRERAWVEINLSALAHNVGQLKSLLSPGCDLMAVVKADAYGHGAMTVAQTVLNAGVTWLGVATIPEGIELREAGISAPILVLGATHSPEQIRSMARWGLEPTLCTPQQALVVDETLADRPRESPSWGRVPVHIKLDTGMSRLGLSWQEASSFVQLVRGLPNLTIASIYSHLATADSPDRTIMREQHDRFNRAIAEVAGAFPGPMPRLHLANSAATLTDKALHYDMVRVGLAVYGLYPAPHLLRAIALEPAMQVKARVTQVKAIAPGTGISYGHQFVAPQPMRVAVAGIGYADGVPRTLSNRMKVLVRGHLVPQVGAITMDQLMLDVTAVPEVQVGEVATLLGREGRHSIGADDWAALCGTISWEILCGFKHRLPRMAVGVLQSLQENVLKTDG